MAPLAMKILPEGFTNDGRLNNASVWNATASSVEKASTVLNAFISQDSNNETMNHDLNSTENDNNNYFVPIYQHKLAFPVNRNTPLTVRESHLFTVTNDYSGYEGLLGNSGPDTVSLAWILPMVIGIVAAMVIIGLLCFFGVRALEFKCMRWCQTNCSYCTCCDGGEERDGLTSNEASNQTELTNYKSAITPDADSW